MPQDNAYSYQQELSLAGATFMSTKCWTALRSVKLIETFSNCTWQQGALESFASGATESGKL